jgi:hypothetical protein
MVKRKRTNNDLQNITQKTKNRVAWTTLKSGGELRCSGRVGSSCSTSGTLRYQWGNRKPWFDNIMPQKQLNKRYKEKYEMKTSKTSCVFLYIIKRLICKSILMTRFGNKLHRVRSKPKTLTFNLNDIPFHMPVEYTKPNFINFIGRRLSL